MSYFGWCPHRLKQLWMIKEFLKNKNKEWGTDAKIWQENSSDRLVLYRFPLPLNLLFVASQRVFVVISSSTIILQRLKYISACWYSSHTVVPLSTCELRWTATTGDGWDSSQFLKLASKWKYFVGSSLTCCSLVFQSELFPFYVNKHHEMKFR